jgi:branched-chain amino acid transport system ATP-binding protein
MALLELADVRAVYGPLRALHGVSLAVEEGSVVAVLGPNGAGKTTTLRAVSGTVRRSGAIVLGGRRIDRLGPEEVARLGVAHVPEGRGTFARLSVRDNLRVGAHARRGRREIERDLERVTAWFPWMARQARQPAGTLSGGEQQMLALARALMSGPRLLLLDEPSLGLAPTVVRELYRIVVELNRETGLAVLAVEQNAAVALGAAHHAFVLESGRVVLGGPSEALARDETVRAAYLGY